jgi:hypothetical protein
MVISWIFNALASELYDSVAYVDSTYEILGELQERFSQGNVPRIHELKREICLAQQKGSYCSSLLHQTKRSLG